MSGLLHDRSEGDVPDERDVSVGRDLGISDARLRDMQETGMTLREAYRIGQAEAMVDHLGAKYGLEFRARSIQEPEAADRTWRLVAEVAGGDLAGLDLVCIWHWYGEDEPHYTDDLVSQARAGEVGDLAWTCVEDAFEGMGAGGVCDVRVGRAQLEDDVTLDTSISDVARRITTDLYLYLPPTTPLSEDEYREAVGRMATLLEARGVSATYLSMRLLDPDGRIAESGGLTLELAQELAAGVPGQPLPQEGIDYDWRLHGTVEAGGE